MRRRGPLGALLLAGALLSAAVPASAAPHHSCGTISDRSGNGISTCPPSQDPYVPDVAAASETDRAYAQALLDRAIAFCKDGRFEDSRYVSGEHAYTPSRFRNHWGHTPSLGRVEFDKELQWASKPKLVVVPASGEHKGEMVGVMYVSGKRQAFPYLGTIPRPHVHHDNPANPMLHVWLRANCSSNLAYAFRAAGPHQTATQTSGHAH